MLEIYFLYIHLHYEVFSYRENTKPRHNKVEIEYLSKWEMKPNKEEEETKEARGRDLLDLDQ